jgi:hypothetical protein
MKQNKGMRLGALFIAMLVVSMAFVAAESAQANKITITNTDKQISLNLDEDCGVLIIPSGDKKSDSIYTDYTDKPAISDVRKTAITQLSGTIDDSNFVSLSGTITIDGKPQDVKLTGQAEKVFVGWDVPEGAKPIYRDVDGRTMTRYEDARRMYASFVELKDDKGKFNLHGEFFEDGVGGLVGTAIINGKECDIGLVGESTSMSENVSFSIQTLSSSETLDVPQRSQWEIWWYQNDYDVASQACGHTVAAMLEEYWTSNHPTIWSIWTNNSNPMSPSEAENYLINEAGVNVDSNVFTGTLTANIDKVEDLIDSGYPFYMTEKSFWGECHAVVVKGYYYTLSNSYFELNDPNTLSGFDTMYRYHNENTFFNFEDNVYGYEGGGDDTSTGFAYVA